MSTANLNPVAAIHVSDTSWMSDANCRKMDVNLFFPARGATLSPFVKEVCSSCDVAEQCLWYANESIATNGVFGGMSPNQREKWRYRNKVRLGMSKQQWKQSLKSNRLFTNPTEWRQDERAV